MRWSCCRKHSNWTTYASSTTITWTYTDDNGNSSTQTQEVIINDVEDPVPVATSLPDVIGECTATVSTVPTAMDNCDGVIDATTSNALIYTTPGTFTVEWISLMQMVTKSSNTKP